MSDHLLPPNATAAERAMALSVKRVSDVPLPVGDLWNPGTCPAAVLPWLAWALSVDIWDANWTETQKRAAIAESVAIHRKKGTVWASRRALEGSIDEAVLQEWFQYGGEPYCYRIETTGGLVDAFTYRYKLLPALKAAKNVRSWLERITVKRQLIHALNLKLLLAKCEKRLIIGVRLSMDGAIHPKVALVPMVSTRSIIAVRLQ